MWYRVIYGIYQLTTYGFIISLLIYLPYHFRVATIMALQNFQFFTNSLLCHPSTQSSYWLLTSVTLFFNMPWQFQFLQALVLKYFPLSFWFASMFLKPHRYSHTAPLVLSASFCRNPNFHFICKEIVRH